MRVVTYHGRKVQNQTGKLWLLRNLRDKNRNEYDRVIPHIFLACSISKLTFAPSPCPLPCCRIFNLPAFWGILKPVFCSDMASLLFTTLLYFALICTAFYSRLPALLFSDDGPLISQAALFSASMFFVLERGQTIEINRVQWSWVPRICTPSIVLQITGLDFNSVSFCFYMAVRFISQAAPIVCGRHYLLFQTAVKQQKF